MCRSGVATAVGSPSPWHPFCARPSCSQIDARLLADKLAARARRLADTDMLTGVPNRRAVFEKIDYLVQQRKPFWMGIFDLDGFKAINDVYGHIAWDDRPVCQSSTAHPRSTSEGATFGRIGGDEFIANLHRHRSDARNCQAPRRDCHRCHQQPLPG
jgi:diguanylate cyclase (GGDEF)-like protein